MSVRDKIMNLTEALHNIIRGALDTSAAARTPTVVTVYCMNDKQTGVWVLGDEDQDPKLVARRLRMAADILDGGTRQ